MVSQKLINLLKKLRGPQVLIGLVPVLFAAGKDVIVDDQVVLYANADRVRANVIPQVSIHGHGIATDFVLRINYNSYRKCYVAAYTYAPLKNLRVFSTIIW